MDLRAGTCARNHRVPPDALPPSPVRNEHVAIIGAPMDLGAGRRGVDMGPSAVRVAGLGRRLAALGYDVTDLGNIPAEQPEAVDDAGPSDARYLPQIAASCER